MASAAPQPTSRFVHSLHRFHLTGAFGWSLRKLRASAKRISLVLVIHMCRLFKWQVNSWNVFRFLERFRATIVWRSLHTLLVKHQL